MIQAAWNIIGGDCRQVMRSLPAAHFHTVCTSPPYWSLRDYGIPGVEWPDGSVCCYGLEPTIDLYLSHTVEICREIRRVLRDDGTLWWNIGDSYCSEGGPATPQNGAEFANRARGQEVICKQARRTGSDGLKAGDQCLIPHRVALALQADGWYLRSTIVWAKRSPMPESVSGWRWVRCNVKLSQSGVGHASQGERRTNTNGFAFSKWQPCPGCPKCSATNGLILKRGRWRPTTAHEYIFLFSKTDRYFCDGEAVKELASANTHHRGSKLRPPKESDSAAAGNGHQSFVAMTPDPVERRNPRSVWTLSSEPFKGAHFATFPSALPRKCIEAATSAAGCCAACGAQYAPVVESERVATRDPGASKLPGYMEGTRLDSYGRDRTNDMEVGRRDPMRHVAVSRVTGHLPTCTCNAATVPCRVLEPFCGSGTTLQVASQLGRESVGIEQNPEYIEIAKRRIVTPLRKPKNGKPKKPASKQGTLSFGETC